MVNQKKLTEACREAGSTAWWLHEHGMVITTWKRISGLNFSTGRYCFGQTVGHFIVQSDSKWDVDTMDERILAIVSHHNLDVRHIRRSAAGQDEVIRLYKSHFPEVNYPNRERVVHVLDGLDFLPCQCNVTAKDYSGST